MASSTTQKRTAPQEIACRIAQAINSMWAQGKPVGLVGLYSNWPTYDKFRREPRQLLRVALTRSLRDQRMEVSNGQKQATANGKTL